MFLIVINYQGYLLRRRSGVMPTTASQHHISPNTKRNPPPSPTGFGFGFPLFGAGEGLGLGTASEKARRFRLFSVPRSAAALTLPRSVIHLRGASSPATPHVISKKQTPEGSLFFWCG